MRNEVLENDGAATLLGSLRPSHHERSLSLSSYREVTVDGARARYLCCGSGPPLLLLASPLALARTYRRAIRTLCRSFTVVCVELPGSGGSERLAEPWTTKRYAEWALELVRYLPLAAPVVVGDGGSTAIAAELAALAPSEIGGLVLVDVLGASGQLGVQALPALVWNAFRHPSTFIEHVKNACTSSPAFTARRLDLRRFVAGLRHRPVFAT